MNSIKRTGEIEMSQNLRGFILRAFCAALEIKARLSGPLERRSHLNLSRAFAGRSAFDFTAMFDRDYGSTSRSRVTVHVCSFK